MESYDLQAAEPSDRGGSKVKSTMVEEEIMVGFEDEAITIKDQLTEGKKQLEIVSIVGMPGLGKTTLARNVFNDPYIEHHFHIRAWTYVSEAYIRRELLLDILLSIVKLTDKIEGMSNEKLGEEIYKRLKGKRYLIVMDDIWSTRAWDDVRIYFPNDNNGSRVMFTSRLTEVGLHAKLGSCPHRLRFLTEEESWELFHTKVFWAKSCPLELVSLGKQIAQKCEGLPLAIVVIAGILAKEKKTREWWEQVAESVSSYIASDQKQYMNTLALSYYHLPNHLKQCFLYFGAFLKGREIPMRKLIWLWVAEKFVQPIRKKKLEAIAEDYLTDLTERSLVIVSQKRSIGGIKACRMHDLLRNLCLRKAEEFNFLAWIRECKDGSFSLNTEANNQHRLCIHPESKFDLFAIRPYARSIQSFFWFGNVDDGSINFFPTSVGPIHSHSESLLSMCCDFLMSYNHRVRVTRADLFHERPSFFESFSQPSLQLSTLQNNLPLSFNHQAFEVLKVLDLWCLDVFFSFEITELVYLRYLAIHIDGFFRVPPSISYLSNLETLILGTRGSHIILPPSVWKMFKLRHLYTRGIYHIDSRCSANAALNDWYPRMLYNLQTISSLCPCGRVEEFLLSSPNLGKLGLKGYLISGSGQLTIPNLEFLSCLETLKLDNTMFAGSTNLLRVGLPANVKKLTLRGMGIRWEEMWTLGWLLPNLEVLKLERRACLGRQWKTTDGGFRRLKFLKLKCLSIVQWIASSTHFPILQHLVLEDCYSLKEIPSGFGDIPTLQMIEVNSCLHFAEESARQIKKRQERNGNNWLKILINNQECPGMNCGSSVETESMGSASEEQ